MSPGHNSSNAQLTPASVAHALELAREDPDAASDPPVSHILETALSQIWQKIQAQPTSYIMTRHEFAVFNYFQHRFIGQEVAVAARRRSAGVMAACDEKAPFLGVTAHETAHGTPLQHRPQTTKPWSRRGLLKVSLVLVLAMVACGLLAVRGCVKGHHHHHHHHNPQLSHVADKVRAPARHQAIIHDVTSVTTSVAASSTPLLDVFQVYQPVLTPSGVTDDTTLSDGDGETTDLADVASTSNCTVTMTLMSYHFANSYGAPFVGNYTPPRCQFNRVTLNFTLQSAGRQFDRLALMYLGDTEVWRTSTPEPTSSGITETYLKDMSEFLSLWRAPQTVIFDLGNIVNDVYTGVLNTTLTATFFNSQDTVTPADLILPISARNGAANSASAFVLPGDNASNTIAFPRNANRAVFTVSACGQATEEFWWSNVFSSDTDTFEAVDGTLYGYSPFREVQVFIDGQLAGVQWPFPVIFTGGVVPGFWRPIVGIDAYDLREHEIDITPWLPVLCDGRDHTFAIKVAGLNDTGGTTGTLTETVGSSWYVTGKIFVWLDEEGSVTTGSKPQLSFPAPDVVLSQRLTQNATGANETLTYSVTVSRALSVSAEVKTQKGKHKESWTQNLSFYSGGVILDQGYVQVNNQTTTGTDMSTGSHYYKTTYDYPLWCNSTYWVDPSGSGNYSITAAIDRALDLTVYGDSVFPTGLQPFSVLPQTASLASGWSGSGLTTRQNGTAFYMGIPSASTSLGYGSTEQSFSFSGYSDSTTSSTTELYARHVEAVNSTLVFDHETLVGATVGLYEGPRDRVGAGAGHNGAATQSPREALGRGPGQPKAVLVQAGQ